LKALDRVDTAESRSPGQTTPGGVSFSPRDSWFRTGATSGHSGTWSRWTGAWKFQPCRRPAAAGPPATRQPAPNTTKGPAFGEPLHVPGRTSPQRPLPGFTVPAPVQRYPDGHRV